MEVGIKRWYNDVRKWGRGNSAEECKETFESLQDLSSFLKKLEVELHKVVWKSCSQSFFLAVGVRLGWGGRGGGESSWDPICNSFSLFCHCILRIFSTPTQH